MIDFNSLTNKAAEQFMLYLPKVAGAIIVLIIGLWVISILNKVIIKRMKKQKVDPTLRSFLKSIVSIALKTLLIITVISMLGVQMTSFIAVLGAAGLAVGLALQGSLANFAGGVLIVLFKPFKVGDLVEAQGFLGKVSGIQIFNTELKTPDNKTVVIPNGELSNGAITNYTTEENRRVDMVFGIGYDDDIAKARTVMDKIIKGDKRIHKDPKPQVVVAELADSSVNFKVRVWAKGADYWNIYFDMHEKIKLQFDKAKISIPYPQQDVHMYKH